MYNVLQVLPDRFGPALQMNFLLFVVNKTFKVIECFIFRQAVCVYLVQCLIIYVIKIVLPS